MIKINKTKKLKNNLKKNQAIDAKCKQKKPLLNT